MNPKETLEKIMNGFEGKISDSRLEETPAGPGDKKNHSIWISVPKKTVKPLIEHLFTIQQPHLTVISGSDLEEEIELIYHLSLGYGKGEKEITINIRTRLSKKDLSIPTITDLIPGGLSTEREIHEFMGVEFEGIPDSRHLFLPDDMDAYPWRDDDERVENYINRLDEQP